MLNGISGASLPVGFPLRDAITAACAKRNFPPCFAGAVKLNETELSTDPGELEEGADPATGCLPNGDNAGHGSFQLTVEWPIGWADPEVNCGFAIDKFLAPAITFWVGKGFSGVDLVRAVAASYNAGTETVWEWHVKYSDVDHGTTDRYGARALEHFKNLIAGRIA